MGSVQTEVFNTLEVTVDNDNVYFPSSLTGCYQVTLAIYGTSNALVPPSLGISNGTTAVIFNNSTDSLCIDDNYTSPTLLLTFFVIPSGGTECSVNFFGGTYPLLPTNGDLIIVKSSPFMVT